jgi:hypothetical protein
LVVVIVLPLPHRGGFVVANRAARHAPPFIYWTHRVQGYSLPVSAVEGSVGSGVSRFGSGVSRFGSGVSHTGCHPCGLHGAVAGGAVTSVFGGEDGMDGGVGGAVCEVGGGPEAFGVAAQASESGGGHVVAYAASWRLCRCKQGGATCTALHLLDSSGRGVFPAATATE